MQIIKKEVSTPEDIQLIVDSFYQKVRENEVIGSYFKDLDWSKHLPVMYSFWSKIILQQDGYKGNPFDKHVKLPNLKEEHFAEWLKLFTETVDVNFQGETAETMKLRASTIAFIFKSKLVK
ncbi:MAG TPA: group III truncated hemoglobin [Cytophagales bacterium]|nr:group III truncated hemoglobin [Cytophagales bacterium]